MSRGVVGQPSNRIRPRRWPRVLRALAIALVVVGATAGYFLQPARLTALILARASSSLHLQLRTSGPGNYALRPEPRLVLPGLSATLPGASAPFFRSDKVEFALPWDTLRGRGTDISSIVLKAPDVDQQGLKSWLATLPPSTTPFKVPRLTRGLQVYDGTFRGSGWKLQHVDLALPSLADGEPATVVVNGDLLRGTMTSKFALNMTSTPAGAGHGVNVSAARLSLKADGELPSLTGSGSLHAAGSFAFTLTGAIQQAPRLWAQSIDSSFLEPIDTPFSVSYGDGVAVTAGNPAPTTAMQKGLRLQLVLGDPKRQPALVLNGQAINGLSLDASMNGQLSRWPNAWSALPAELASNTAPIVFDASYQGSMFLTAPVALHVKRADASMQGQFRVAEIRKWIRQQFAGVLSPAAAKNNAPQLDIGGNQSRGVQAGVHDDAAAPAQPAATPPKS